MASWYQRPARRPRQFTTGLIVGIGVASAVSWLVALALWKEWL